MLFELEEWFSSIAFTLALLNRPGRAVTLVIAAWIASRLQLPQTPVPLASLQADLLAASLITWAERTTKREPNGVFRNLKATYRLFFRVLLGPLLLAGAFFSLLKDHAPHLQSLLEYVIPRGALALVIVPLASQLTSRDRSHFVAQLKNFFTTARGRMELITWLILNGLIIQSYMQLRTRPSPEDALGHAEYFAIDFLISIPIFFSALRFPPLLNAVCMLLLAIRATITAASGLGPFWDLPAPDRQMAVGLYILVFGSIGSLLNTQQEESRTVREELALRAETRARELEAERTRASREHDARESAERLVETRNRFLSIASHELKNPLAALLLTLEMLERQLPSDAPAPAPSALHTTARNAVNEARRMARLIDNLLDISRLESDRLERRSLEEINLTEMLHCTLAGFQGLLQSAGCATRVQIQPDLRVFADADQVQQIFQNLISNAIKFGRRQPIDITLEQAGAEWRFDVRDRGVGIPAGIGERIFEPYNRTADRTRFPGMGIGLHVSRDMARAIGGDITYQPAPGGGTEFTVRCPLSPSAELPIQKRKAA